MTTLAYSYVRLSTAEQLKGDGVDRQLERTRSYAEQHGWELVDRMRDTGISAFHAENHEIGALAAFHGKVRQGKVPKA
jgi:DNA invertase Pin-like site-specific DNA recombinase